jgi:hypothetical protein
MKFPRILLLATTAGSLILPLAASSQAEEAKVPFAQGVRVEVMIGRPSKVKGGDFDDKTQVIEPRIKLTNTANQQAYVGYKAAYYLICESAAQRGTYKVMLKHDFDITLTPKQAMESEAGSITTQYDTTGAVFGFKYDGWVIQITDSKGEIVLTKSTSKTLEKMAAELKTLLKVEQCYNRQWRPCAEPRF